MLISVGSDFLALCREQISLLTQALGASFTVVYLTEEIVETPAQESRLIPVMVYPETSLLNYGNDGLDVKVTKPISIDNIFTLPNQAKRLLAPTAVYTDDNSKRNLWDHLENLQDHQIVSPLIYEGVMMGLLVTGREDRSWNETEEGEIQRIAKTLAIACILEQRRAWLQQQLHQEKILQSQQRDLLDNLLHQFRNPLTAIRTFGKLLLKRFIPTDQNREVAISIVHESDRLQGLLQQFDQVIDLTTTASAVPSEVIITANVQNGGTSTLLLPGTGDDLTNCQLADIIKPLLTSAQAIAQERNLQLMTDIPSNLPLVKVNIKALQEVLSNIIDNALKYTPQGGKILISIGEKKEHFQGIIISDSGFGIPPEDLAHLGERYYRGNKSQTQIPGTGLGIAIAKQLIAEMQGKLEVFSPAINPLITSSEYPGTTVIIWLLENIADDK